MLIFMLFHTDFSRPFLLQSVILFTQSIRLFKSTPCTGSLYVTNSYLHTLGKLLLLLKSSYLFTLKLRSKTLSLHKIHESYIQKIWRNSLKKNYKICKVSKIMGNKSNIQNQLYFYTFATNNPKLKLRKLFHSNLEKNTFALGKLVCIYSRTRVLGKEVLG